MKPKFLSGIGAMFAALILVVESIQAEEGWVKPWVGRTMTGGQMCTLSLRMTSWSWIPTKRSVPALFAYT
jgi:hypothetical protein